MMEIKVNKLLLEKLIEGYWFRAPKDDWVTTHISENIKNLKGNETLFIAMDKVTWLKGTGNSGVYSEWTDTHMLVEKYADKINGVVAQRPILGLPPSVPQYIVKDTFEFINNFFVYVRKNLTSKIISITGTVGKTTTKELLARCLKLFGSIYATQSNHNSRTGVKLTIANSMHNPNYVVVETAVAALWMKNGGINIEVKPDFAIITEVGVGQRGYGLNKMADFKSKIANGLSNSGWLIVNRDIVNFDEVIQYANRYTKNIITYGRHEDSQVHLESDRGILTINIEGQVNSFKTSVFDYGSQSNVAAVIAILHVMKLDFVKCFDIFNKIQPRKSVLEEVISSNKEITIVDDTYNAEYLSVKNAFEYCKNQYLDKRKVAIVGDIVNLEKQSKVIHESLIDIIYDNDFSFIATFGDQSKYLNRVLPGKMNLGHFNDVHHCLENISSFLEYKDLILIKGSRRNSSIHLLPKLLLDKIESKNNVIKNEIAYIFSTEEDFQNINININIKYGLGSLILLNLALQKYIKGDVNLGTVYKVTKNVSNESERTKLWDMNLNEEYNFLQIFQICYLTQNSTAILALAELLFGSTANALTEIKKYAIEIGMDDSSILNVTGRDFKNTQQQFKLKYIYLLANKIFSLPKKALDLFSAKAITFNKKIIKSSCIGWNFEYVDFIIFIGDSKRRTYITCAYEKNMPKIGIFSNLLSENRLAYLVPYLYTGQALDQISEKINVSAKTAYINLLGDTYFGEAYTEKRKKRGINDALQKYGYDYSFKKIMNFFPKDDLNIVNFEAVFHEFGDSPLKDIKGFILGANSKKTISTLKKFNIQHLVLANNHAKDFGGPSLLRMLSSLKENDIKVIGAGATQKESMNFYEISYADKKYVIFNGYWHRNIAYDTYDFYALGDQSGVASLEGLLLNQIQIYKEKNSDHKIIVVAHWGIDFKAIDPYQQKTAKLLVEAGADVVIGHGPHMLQQIQYINNKPIIFSIGNGVFNSNGEYAKYQALPYGAIAKIDMDKDVIRLYPIFTDNLQSFWQPYPVEIDDAIKAFSILTGVGDTSKDLLKDKNGYFMELDI